MNHKKQNCKNQRKNQNKKNQKKKNKNPKNKKGIRRIRSRNNNLGTHVSPNGERESIVKNK